MNLPNDEFVQLERGTRRLQIKNVMQAKFDAILAPIADELLDPAQREHVKFESFFANTMFHEVAHGLGIKNTINDRGTVRDALQEHASWIEEGKADILGLHMIRQLVEAGELPDVDIDDNYVTFCTSMFRSIRFGSASAHGRANLVRFNYFVEAGAFTVNPDTGRYTVNLDTLAETVAALAALILNVQGDGDRDRAATLWDEFGMIAPSLERALDRLGARDIPVDLIYRQGLDVLGLRPAQ